MKLTLTPTCLYFNVTTWRMNHFTFEGRTLTCISYISTIGCVETAWKSSNMDYEVTPSCLLWMFPVSIFLIVFCMALD